MDVNIKNLTPGMHGFHIHSSGDLNGDCKNAGGHYNPYGNVHGAPSDEDRHVGALGNVFADEGGYVQTTIEDRKVRLYGDDTVVGRSCLVHGGEDDLGRGGNDSSLANGNAGPRVACGVINEEF
jgi:Cu-Zn family superoxide dismutase